ncbi:single-strand binding protein/Primosomal replication protein n [Ruminiclostridium papyrosolvens DSM 2782]|uniref:Single-strand binding protein/Primosomal replication protein n n=1 Tax=Ruminiclostridium papyrosolvens DSM 2782 TaxID=588581 RepID=F1TDM6_9FIRM|nr:single-stranded DNA-binding protein [Ruminiclostridium papyrosolvens]EGD47664.1 single-strand binding protein/Primosomal replication protein n [Ruminiclostridium papyrosolvens DSM 2782]WES36394.1 single-stranded DNA-binding protein [Ruminiclostridium papyrosolvens DSM 2782]
MVGNVIENNVVTISGRVVSEVEYSHEVYGEGFYSFQLDVPRLSESSDKISVTFSERLVPKEKLVIGSLLEIEGQFRSYNSYKSESNKLVLTVFAREVVFIDEDKRIKNPNQIYLNGYICKSPIYRMTPFGREITDILVAVNRPYNKSDYIPCIAWGRNARYSQNLSIGDNIKIWGRIQSREYQKKLESGETLTKTAYEVSVSKMEISEPSATNENDENDENNDIENSTEE